MRTLPWPPCIDVWQHGDVLLGQVLQVAYTVPGDPTTWKRAGRGHHSTFNNDDHTWAAAKIAHGYQRAVEDFAQRLPERAERARQALEHLGRKFPQAGSPWGPRMPVFLEIDVYLERPKSSKLLTPCCDRNDWDNYAKLCSDALQGYAYHRDGQVIGGTPCKHYGDPPRTEIRLTFCVEPTPPPRQKGPRK